MIALIIKGLEKDSQEHLKDMRTQSFDHREANKILTECLVIEGFKKLNELEEERFRLIKALNAYINDCEDLNQLLKDAQKEILRMYAERIDNEPKRVQEEKRHSSMSACGRD